MATHTNKLLVQSFNNEEYKRACPFEEKTSICGAWPQIAIEVLYDRIFGDFNFKITKVGIAGKILT